jgi:serine/threonine protein kinase
MADRVGQHLGNYRLTRLLGRGGFAEVYLAEHLRLGTQAAIKVLLAHLASEEDAESFQKEARTIARLVHPHIVRVLDFDVQEGTPFLVMDYAPNGTLRQRHPRGMPLAPADILPYVKQVAAALQYAHDEKLIHRDIKPENMLLGRSNDILLSDFGIALMAQSSRQQSTQEVVGTVAYMAPEQIQGKPRPASDQYSLGIVIYEWLTGDRPFHGSFTEVCTQHLFAPPPPMREKLPNLAQAVEEVVMTALSKDYKQRFANMQAFATAFEQACQMGALLSAPTQRMQPSASRLPPTSILTPPNSGAPPTVISTPPTPAAPPTIVVPPAHTPANEPNISAPRLSRSGAPAQPAGTLLCTYRGHMKGVRSLAWSPDGSRIASGGFDNTVQLWKPDEGNGLYIYKGHADVVESVAWSPDSKRMVSGSNDQTAQVWDARDGRNGFTYFGHSSYVYSVAWSPDGRRIVSGSYDQTAQVWDASNGANHIVYRGHSSVVESVAWSRDNRHIASGSDDQTVQVWTF